LRMAFLFVGGMILIDMPAILPPPAGLRDQASLTGERANPVEQDQPGY
jgi:hypothetical protein